MYKTKYARTAKKLNRDGTQGRHQNPDLWITGPDPIRRDKYYAWLKHRAQANFRNEPYTITWEDWERLWSDELFLNRGRKMDNVCMFQITHGEGWHLHNVAVEVRCTSKSFNGKRPKEQ